MVRGPLARQIPQMNELKKNDQFLELLAQHEAQIFGFLYALVGHRQDAEDLMQQTTMAMWKHFDQFELGTNFSAWACRIAKNRALNFFQSRDRRRVFTTEVIELLERTEAARPPEERLARRSALHSCLSKLSAKDRSLVEQCYSAGASIKGVAHALGRPAAGVYNSLSRIRQTLFRCVESTLVREA